MFEAPSPLSLPTSYSQGHLGISDALAAEDINRRGEVDSWTRAITAPSSEQYGSHASDVPDENYPNAPSNAPSAHNTPSPRSSLDRRPAATRRRGADRKLHPYQHDAVDAFEKETSIGREATLFIALCAIEHKVNAILAATPPFSVSSQLLDDVKTYTLTVLLSPKLSAHKGHAARDHILGSTWKNSLHLPVNIKEDPHVQNELRSTVGHEVTQARVKIIKEIEAAISKNECILVLAAKLVGDTRCVVSIPMCACIALHREVFQENSGSHYWDDIDKRLKSIRKVAGGDTKKITKAFTAILEADRSTYGVNEDYFTSGDNNIW